MVVTESKYLVKKNFFRKSFYCFFFFVFFISENKVRKDIIITSKIIV